MSAYGTFGGVRVKLQVAREHLQLNSNSAKSAISRHISSCQSCQNCNLDVSSFKVIKNYDNEYETKIQKACINKKANTTIEFTIIRQRLLFTFECVLKFFFFFFFFFFLCIDCLYCTMYRFIILQCCLIFLFFFSDLILLWKRCKVSYCELLLMW